jgi:predicted NBD/HSP70 family sugar kinase
VKERHRTVSERLLDGVLIHGRRIEREELTQEEFWEVTKIGKTEGTRIRQQFMASGTLRDRGSGKHRRTRMALGKRLGYVLGASLGTESLRVALIDANGDLAITAEDDASPLRAKAKPEQLLEDLAVLVRTVLEQALARPDLLVATGREAPYLPLLGVAVAWPTPLHRQTKLPTGQSLHPEWGEPPSLPDRVAKRLGIPSEFSSALNDANACALSAVFDDTRSAGLDAEVHRSWVSLVVRLGGGIGAATVLVDKHDPTRSAFAWSRLVEGTQGLAGELGHLEIPPGVVAELNKRKHPGLARLDLSAPCSCGRAGHLESVAGGAALARRIEASPDLDAEALGLQTGTTRKGPARMDDIVKRLSGPSAKAALEDIGQLLGHALAGPILMLNPRRITLTGSLAHEYVENGIGMARGAWSSLVSEDPQPRLLQGAASQYAAARGAALAVFRKQVYRRWEDIVSRGGGAQVLQFRAGDLPVLGLTVRTRETAAERVPNQRRGRRQRSLG